MADTTAPTPKPDDAQTAHKAWFAALYSAALSALVTACVVTFQLRRPEVAGLWTWLWCSPTNGIACPDVTKAVALKGIIETLVDQWWTALVAATATGPLTGLAVYFKSNKSKEK